MDSTISQDLESLEKRSFFQMAMEKFWNFCLGKFLNILEWINIVYVMFV